MSMTSLFALLSLVSTPPPEPKLEGPRTILEATTTVPPEQDGCLNHTIAELGMSAKRDEKERLWRIKPQFLHSSVIEGGEFSVRMEPASSGTRIVVLASWPGKPKEAAIQREIEARISVIPAKMAQLCGVTRASVECRVRTGGGEPTRCAPAMD